MAAQTPDPVGEDIEQPADRLADLAAFLMHHAYDPGMSDADRLQTFGVVEAFQEGDDPPAVELTMRNMAVRFRAEPGYRQDWLPRGRPQA